MFLLGKPDIHSGGSEFDPLASIRKLFGEVDVRRRVKGNISVTTYLGNSNNGETPSW